MSNDISELKVAVVFTFKKDHQETYLHSRSDWDIARLDQDFLWSNSLDACVTTDIYIIRIRAENL